MKITKIQKTRDRRKKRVAAYCRVSTTLENQEDSYETQQKYYSNYIKAHEDWEYAGIYSDEKSGLKAANRAGFQKMVREALDGESDYVLVKSISRFSRNIVDCQTYAEMLHTHGVDIHFEKENLDTADPSCSMMFSFLSAVAQDESRSISENVKWASRERVKRGEYKLGKNSVFGYDSMDGKPVPNDDAPTVREVFRMFLDGMSGKEIAAVLEQADVKGRRGKPLTASGIRYMLQNEIYVGDRLLQKRPPKDLMTKQPDRTAEYESNYLKDDHEAIIDRETWEKTQNLIRKKQNEVSAGIKDKGRSHFLYGHVFCGECGSPMTRRTIAGRKSRRTGKCEHYKLWFCSGRRKGTSCQMHGIREEALLKEISRQLGWEWNGIDSFPVERFLKLDQKVIVQKDGITIEQKQ